MLTSEIEEVHPFNSMKSTDCYQVMEELGRSETGVTLYRAKYIKSEPTEVSEKVVVIKVFERQFLMNNVMCLTRDIEHSRYSDHKNVSKIYCSFLENGDLIVVMKNDHVASLEQVIAKRFRTGLPERMVGFVLKEVLEGLDYLHGRKWMHKSLDIRHVFVDKDDVIRIDFDTLAYDPDTKFSDSDVVTWPPEMLTNDGLELKSDIWYVGIIALKLAIGHIPARSYEELFAFLAEWSEKVQRTAAEGKKEIKRGRRSWVRRFGCFYGRLPTAESGEEEKGTNGDVSGAFVKMVRECLIPEQSKRPSARQLLECDFFRELQRGQKPSSFIESLFQ